jgi:hypothetical protein
MGDWEVSVTMAMIAGSFLFAYLYANTDRLNKFLKILFLAAALLMGIGTLGIQENIIDSNAPTVNATIIGAVQTSYSMQIWIFRIVMTLFVVYMIYMGAMYALGRKIPGPEEDR